MATITRKKILDQQQFGGVPYGNRTEFKFNFDTSAAGVFTDGDATAAVGIGDKVRLGTLPAGFDVRASLAILSAVFTAASTADIGFEYVDGVDSATVPQNAAYFYSGLALSAAARTVMTNATVRPVLLPKDVYLILTNKVAAQNVAGKLDLLIDGVLLGAP